MADYRRDKDEYLRITQDICDCVFKTSFFLFVCVWKRRQKITLTNRIRNKKKSAVIIIWVFLQLTGRIFQILYICQHSNYWTKTTTINALQPLLYKTFDNNRPLDKRDTFMFLDFNNLQYQTKDNLSLRTGLILHVIVSSICTNLF